MRKIKEVLRLKYELGLGQRQIARSCSIGLGTVNDYLVRAERAGTKQMTVKAVGEQIYQIPYESIRNLSYEEASRHRVKEGAVVMIFSLGAGGVVMLTKSKSHWFYVDYGRPDGEDKTLTLKLDKSEYKKVLATASEQTGKRVETLDPLPGGPRNR